MVSQQIGIDGHQSLSASYDRLARRALQPGRVAALLARAHPGFLDEQLIRGSDPARSRQLAARAATLTSRRTRVSLAEGLERLLTIARGHRQHSALPLRAAHVLANASALHELAILLRGNAPLYVRGIVMVNRLLTDGIGPAYTGDAAALARRLQSARAALQGHDHDKTVRRPGAPR
jgi:hypothetical protein